MPTLPVGRSDGIQNLSTNSQTNLAVDTNGTIQSEYKNKGALFPFVFMVGVTGFEPTTSYESEPKFGIKGFARSNDWESFDPQKSEKIRREAARVYREPTDDYIFREGHVREEYIPV